MRVPDFLKEALRLIRHGLRPCAFSTRKRVLQRVLFGGSDCVAEALSVFFFRLCPKGESFAVVGLSVSPLLAKIEFSRFEFDLAAGLPADLARHFTALPWKSPELHIALGFASKRDRRFWRFMDSTTGGALYPPAPCIPQ
jgi:hypothetical protein